VTAALRRAAETLLVLLVLSVLTFLLTSLAPGDPAEEILRRGGIQPTAESVAVLRGELGLDQPLFTQYLQWLLGVLRGDFGRSHVDRAPVAAEILSRVPATLRLAGTASLVAVGLAVLVSVRAALRPRAFDSRIARVVMVAIAAVPPYISGILLISVVAVGMRVLPTGGEGSPGAVILPALTLGLAGTATLLRLLAADLSDVARQPFVKLAVAKGLTARRTVVVHMLRVAAPGAITASGVVLTELLAGAVIVETLFAWPGVGQLAVTAIRQRDIPIVQAYVLLTALATALVLTLADLCVSVADPRVRR
jgi:ABC-type dipeptide/oligopeptide/nickel transport system permease component